MNDEVPDCLLTGVDRLQAATRPRMTPAELVQSFASRGVTITVGQDGNLRVLPADMLTPADLEVLTACKLGILAALAARGASPALATREAVPA